MIRYSASWLSPILVGGVALALGGCASLFLPLSLRDVEAKYGPTGAHWLKPIGPMNDVLLLGPVEDPATTNGRIIPSRYWPGYEGVGEARWFNWVGLNRLYVFERPTTPKNQTWNFGPKEGDPEGVYIYEKHPASYPQCEQYRAAMKASLSTSSTYSPFSPIVPKESCLTYGYLGELSLGIANFIEISYFDQPAREGNEILLVSELRRGEHDVVARSVACAAAVGALPPPPCKGPVDLMAIFKSISH